MHSFIQKYDSVHFCHVFVPDAMHHSFIIITPRRRLAVRDRPTEPPGRRPSDGDDVVDVVRASVVAASRQRRVRAMVRDRARRRGRERDIHERRARPARAETLG